MIRLLLSHSLSTLTVGASGGVGSLANPPDPLVGTDSSYDRHGSNDIYVRSVYINGHKLSSHRIAHQDIVNGGYATFPNGTTAE